MYKQGFMEILLGFLSTDGSTNAEYGKLKQVTTYSSHKADNASA
jgi:hypothetical protein